MSTRREIEDARVIAGFMREALFQEAELRINASIVAYIVDIEEDSRRSRSEERHFVIRLKNDETKLNHNQHMFSVQFSNFVVTFEAEATITATDEIRILFPKKVLVSNLREEDRVSAQYIGSEPSPVIIVVRGLHSEGRFTLSNLSRAGFGGILSISKILDLECGATLRGVLTIPDGRIVLFGHILHFKLEKSSAGHNSYYVNLGKMPTESKENKIYVKRKETRYRSSRTIIVRSPINPHQDIPILLDNVSVSGFRGICASPIAHRLLIPGSSIILDRTTLVASVIETADSCVNAEWISGNEKDRLTWLRLITEELCDTAFTSTPAAEEVLSVFCQSGSLGSEFLKAHQTSRKNIIRGLETEGNTSEYVHRWIDKNSKVGVSGHISALRFGDSAWMLGDVVGGNDRLQKMSSEFIPKFITSFKECCLVLSPCPMILAIYVEGHPYWQQFEAYLATLNQPISEKAIMSYTKTLSTANISPEADIVATEIKASDYMAISLVADQLQHNSMRIFAEALGFSIGGFAAPRLEAAVSASNKEFWRKYFKFEQGSCQFLVVFTFFPIGSNPNRIVDSAWCFLLAGEEKLNDRLWQDISNEIKLTGIRLGVSIPSIRRIMPVDQRMMLPSEEVLLSCHLFHPSALNFFGKLG